MYTYAYSQVYHKLCNFQNIIRCKQLQIVDSNMFVVMLTDLSIFSNNKNKQANQNNRIKISETFFFVYETYVMCYVTGYKLSWSSSTYLRCQKW